MDRQVIHTPDVPPARVPLSQGIKAGDWIFVSGQLGNDPRSGKLAAFPIDPTARTTFECARLLNDARVEIEAIASLNP